jgi:hypothetical protein
MGAQQAQREQANKKQFERNMEQIRQQDRQWKEQNTPREEREADLSEKINREQRQWREQKEQAKQQAEGGAVQTNLNTPGDRPGRRDFAVTGILLFVACMAMSFYAGALQMKSDYELKDDEIRHPEKYAAANMDAVRTTVNKIGFLPTVKARLLRRLPMCVK